MSVKNWQQNTKLYRILYLFNAFLIGMIISVAFLSNSNAATFADDDPVHELTENHFVTIHDQGQQLTIKTDASTVGEAIERANILVSETDTTEPATTSTINADNFHINIYRSRPVFIIDGITRKYLMTSSYDPTMIAKEANITIYDGDKITLLDDPSQFLETGATTTYKITRNGGQTITSESVIPYGEETIKDPDLEVGQTKVTQPGEDGRKTTKYRVNFVDGVEVSRELISEEVTKAPVNRIVAQGSKQAVPPEWESCANWARQAGVSDGDLHTALTLIYRESGCRVTAENAYSGAYGIPQALPGGKMASAGADWETNPITQIRWMISYVNGRYGGWSGAMNYWNAHGNY
ncbi:G5 domain-containing protein [Candidatus Saccharibacteria bacterium]|nr:G5 domain-containing protein [Candidatus Saccharibacteria bacterium]